MALLNGGKWLVVAPHADDEVLGLGPLLCVPDEITVVLCSHRPDETPEEAQDKVEAVLHSLRDRGEGAQDAVTLPVWKSHEGWDPAVLEEDIRDRLDGVDTLLIPHSSSYHQDHWAAHTSGVVATRPWKRGHGLAVYAYQVLSDMPPSMGNVVVEVTSGDVARAAEAFENVYADQVRQDTGRSRNGIENWAAVCGEWIGKHYAWSLNLIQSAEYLG